MKKTSTTFVTPYSGIHARSLNCCGFFFPCEETGLSSDGYMTDIIRGIKHSPNNNNVLGSIANVVPSTTNQNTVYPNNAGSNLVGLLNGSWPTLGTNSFLMLAVANVQNTTTAKIPVGNGTGSYGTYGSGDISLSFTGGMHVHVEDSVLPTPNTDSTTTDAAATLTVDTDVILIVRYQPNTLLQGDVYNSSGSLVASSTTPFSDLTQTKAPSSSITGISPPACTRVSGLAFYGWAGFIFSSGIPADWKSGCFWMAADWMSKSTNRYLYPAWNSL